MAKPNGGLIRFPILQKLGQSLIQTISQKVITDNLNLKLDKSSAYTKADIDNLFSDNIINSLGNSTTASPSQKAVNDALNLRYTKTETDNKFVTKELFEQDKYLNHLREMSEIGDSVNHNIDKPFSGFFHGYNNLIKGGTRPYSDSTYILFEAFMGKPEIYNGTDHPGSVGHKCVSLFHKVTRGPDHNSPYSSEIKVRTIFYDYDLDTCLWDSGWSNVKSLWGNS